jgi:ribosomal protein S18 acetylase RimI-like enzyme
MEGRTAANVRAFDGSLADAHGLLAVERATFNESPYSAEQIQAMLTDSPQRAWLAFEQGSVAGFAVAFVTNGLLGSCWEIDLLAVTPAWTGRGLATRLIQAASEHGTQVACRARAFVANDNPASVRAFTRVGFRAGPETCRLLIYRSKGAILRSGSSPGIAVSETTLPVEAKDWLMRFPEIDLPSHDFRSGLTLLLAEKDSRPAGYAELIEVQTLLYHGVWIESLVAPSPAVHDALVRHTVERAKTAGLDEIGAMVPKSKQPLQDSLLSHGFRSLGDFYRLAADLPLPSFTQSRYV